MAGADIKELAQMTPVSGRETALRGQAGDLALAMCGRTVPAGRLDGAPLPAG